MSEPAAVYLPSADVAYRKIGGNMVLVHTIANRMVSLNETGSTIWERLDGSNVAEIADALVSVFHIDHATAAADTVEFLESLRHRRFVDLKSHD